MAEILNAVKSQYYILTDLAVIFVDLVLAK